MIRSGVICGPGDILPAQLKEPSVAIRDQGCQEGCVATQLKNGCPSSGRQGAVKEAGALLGSKGMRSHNTLTASSRNWAADDKAFLSRMLRGIINTLTKQIVSGLKIQNSCNISARVFEEFLCNNRFIDRCA